MLNPDLETTENELDHNSLAKQLAHLHDHIILCGLHNLGYRILEQLLEAQIPVVVIDDSPDLRFARLAKRQGVVLISEDSRQTEILEVAGIERAQALIVVNENDLHNLETVLAAHEIFQGIRTVASFFNNNIGQQIERMLPNIHALDLHELAAPVFVNATLFSDVVHRFTLQGQEFVVVDAASEKRGQLGEIYPENFTLLLRSPSQREISSQATVTLDGHKKPKTKAPKFKSIIWPTYEADVEYGDHVALIGRLEELQQLSGVALRQPEPNAKKKTAKTGRLFKRSPLITFSSFINSVIGELERPFQATLIALLIIVVVSTIFFTLTHQNSQGNDDLNPLNALYFTITIITTIGFGDISLVHQHWWEVAYGIFLELVGAGSLAVLYAYLTNFIVSRRIEKSLGIQRATDMQDHVIVTGLGNVGFGYTVVEGLINSRESVVVIEADDQNRFVSLARSLGAIVIFGDSRLAETLKQANLAKARCMVVASNDDMTNLETALAARSLRPDIRVVLRLFDRNLADKIERTFGIENANSTSAVSAPRFIAAALNYEVITSFYIRRQVFIVVKLVVDEAGQLAGKHSQWLYQHSGVRVLAHIGAPYKIRSKLEGELVIRVLDPTFYPTDHILFKDGDSIIFVGTYDCVLRVHQLNSPQT